MKFLSTAAAVMALGQAGLSSAQALLGKPSFEFLYTANISLGTPWDIGDFGLGSIQVLPIISGVFEGPKIKGNISHLGADWLHMDKFGVTLPDTRYNLLTDDGANIYIRTSGASLEDGRYVLRGVFQTGHEDYRWLNYIITYGTLYLYPTPDDFRIQIDMWQVSFRTLSCMTFLKTKPNELRSPLPNTPCPHSPPSAKHSALSQHDPTHVLV